jgi:peptide/nickel transport system ATP-binding protein
MKKEKEKEKEKRRKDERLHEIPGIGPTYSDISKGCRFHHRCPHVMDICREYEPDLTELDDGDGVRCWLRQ